jgi:ABC-type molybdate transport system permease subunit
LTHHFAFSHVWHSARTALAFARALGEFGATLMLAGKIPEQTQMIPMAILLLKLVQ